MNLKEGPTFFFLINIFIYFKLIKSPRIHTIDTLTVIIVTHVIVHCKFVFVQLYQFYRSNVNEWIHAYKVAL